MSCFKRCAMTLGGHTVQRAMFCTRTGEVKVLPQRSAAVFASIGTPMSDLRHGLRS